jgi:PST family polysaccharide transporter
METATTTEPGGHSVGYIVTRGMFWMSVNTVGVKLLSIAAQIVVAWLVMPEDMGLVGLAFTVVGFTTLIQQAGLSEILVQRGRHFRRWANPAFWMSITLGLVAGLITLAAAPLAARLYEDARVTGLLLVLALSMPLTAVSLVPMARITSQMQFRYLALTNAWTNSTTLLLTVLLAWRGFGAYSFVWPRVIVAMAQAAVLWPKARPPIRRHPQLRRWRFLVGDSGRLFVNSLFGAVVGQGDKIALGRIAAADIVGLYYWGFHLATQTIVMITVNLGGVLLPALSRFADDKVMQLKAFVRASSALAIVGIPLTLLQVALAEPFVHALFQPKWYGAIPVIQLLSLGMTLSMVGATGISFLQAQGHWKTLMHVTIVFTVFFVIGVSIAVWAKGMIGVAWAVALYHGMWGPACIYIALRKANGTLRDLARIYLPAVIASLIAFGIALLAAWFIPQMMPYRNWIFMGIVTTLVAALYVPLIGRLAPENCIELTQQFKRLLRQGREARGFPVGSL